MNFIIEGNYDTKLINVIIERNLPVSHVIIHAPHNPIGNGSILLPEEIASREEFEQYTKFILDKGLIPVFGIDSSCQGNLEAHIEHFKAYQRYVEEMIELGYENVLVSSPNILAFIKKNFPSLNIFLSYAQFTTSTNRAKIYFHMGAKSIILHPDILRYFPAMRNLIKLQSKNPKIENTNYVLPLNLGCNWSCIYWFDHHNMQSHRTIESPVSSNELTISDVENAFDFPVLSCWKKRLERPDQVLKSGWISPFNIEKYEEMGYDTFLLFTYGFSAEKIIDILESYLNKSSEGNFTEFLNIPHPYGEYGLQEDIEHSLIQLDAELVKEFCDKFPYEHYYPEEDEMNTFCIEYARRAVSGNEKQKTNLLSIMQKNLEKLERGAINE
ncbi:MAG: hypothetical protein GF317_16435 [Candidatus Lokiarchaeota archaeon]|nr:hypothetical protein [Candidatus Lokiarchaeota archaeon]MBD3201123.1 hypothetical protein [Candidatus Lokiarchaeota archaeon]